MEVNGNKNIFYLNTHPFLQKTEFKVVKNSAILLNGLQHMAYKEGQKTKNINKYNTQYARNQFMIMNSM